MRLLATVGGLLGAIIPGSRIAIPKRTEPLPCPPNSREAVLARLDEGDEFDLMVFLDLFTRRDERGIGR